jgi:hypothetical protein
VRVFKAGIETTAVVTVTTMGAEPPKVELRPGGGR